MNSYKEDTNIIDGITKQVEELKRRRDREERIRRYYGTRLNDEYYDEAQFLAAAKAFLEMLEGCLVVREAHGTKSGIADLLICYQGRFVAAELKAIYGVPSANQIKFLEKVAAAKGVGGICDTLQSVWDLLNKAIG